MDRWALTWRGVGVGEERQPAEVRRPEIPLCRKLWDADASSPEVMEQRVWRVHVSLSSHGYRMREALEHGAVDGPSFTPVLCVCVCVHASLLFLLVCICGTWWFHFLGTLTHAQDTSSFFLHHFLLAFLFPPFISWTLPSCKRPISLFPIIHLSFCSLNCGILKLGIWLIPLYIMV